MLMMQLLHDELTINDIGVRRGDRKTEVDIIALFHSAEASTPLMLCVGAAARFS